MDPNFLEIFSNDVGQPLSREVLAGSSVVLSKPLALRLFGTHEAVGQRLQLVGNDGQSYAFVVGGVQEKWPSNTSFTFSLLAPMEQYVRMHELEYNDWAHWVDGTFLFAPDQPTSSLLAPSIVRCPCRMRSIPTGSRPIRASKPNGMGSARARAGHVSLMAPLHPASMVGLLSSAICVLLLAGFNFANTSIAAAAKRLKEVPFAKRWGPHARDVITMLILENMVLITIALILSVGLSYLLIPHFNAMFSIEIVQPQRADPAQFGLYTALLWLLMTLLAAGYPAIYLSKFQSIEIFREKVKLGGKNYFAKIMLALEFVIVFYNLFAIGAYVSNSYYQEALDTGYDMEGVLNIPLYQADNYQVISDRISGHRDIVSQGGTQDLIGFGAEDMHFQHEGVHHQVERLHVSTDYLQVSGVRLQRGRFFLNDRTADEIVINELLDAKLGGSMLHQQLRIDDKSYKIVGIVDDFKNRPAMLGAKMEPTILFSAKPASYRYLAVKSETVPVDELKREMETPWQAVFPDLLYRGFPQEDTMASVRQTNNIIVKINLFVSIVAIAISALGLYALVSLGIQRRTKEFGIRKVLGATSQQIFYLINRELFLLIILAAIFSLPTAGYFTNRILDIVFTYHVELSAIYYLLPLLAVGVIAVGSVGFKAWRSASSNPVEHLRLD